MIASALFETGSGPLPLLPAPSKQFKSPSFVTVVYVKFKFEVPVTGTMTELNSSSIQFNKLHSWLKVKRGYQLKRKAGRLSVLKIFVIEMK